MNESSSHDISEKIHGALVEPGRRQTRAKTRISARLTELASSGEVFTVEALWHDLQRLDPHLGRATVFRAVETLVGLGLLNRIDFSDGSHSYRACGDQHHHLICKKCHRVVDIDVCLPEEQLIEIGAKNNFKIEGHSLAFFGTCADCQGE
jgi:Fur family ferric uptake transcriptional regulator